MIIPISQVRFFFCFQIYRALCPRSPVPKPRVAALRALYDPSHAPSRNTVLDSGALVFYFPSPRTVTGEDILELHVHGGPAIVKAVLAAIAKCNSGPVSVRYAEPGEFTRRAFMNDRLDLPQIEALGDTLAADTEQQRRLAVRGASDALSKRYELWRNELLQARGELEALIDFSEDQHFDESPQEFVDSVASQVRALRRQILFHIQNASKGELLRNGLRVALLGAPNAGKSSLLNQVVGKEAAIVSTEEGTTRDIVDVGIDLGGWYCKLGDMAGLRPGSDGDSTSIGAVEKEGIRRAKARALESDVVVVVLSVDENGAGAQCRLKVEAEVVEAVRSCQEQGRHIVVAINKSDRLSPSDRDETAQAPRHLVEHVRTLFDDLPERRIHAISCKEAQNASSPSLDPGKIQSFLRGLLATFEEIAKPEGLQGSTESEISYWEDSLGVTQRQQSSLQTCLEHLNDFLSETHARIDNQLDPEAPTDANDGKLQFPAMPKTPSNAAHDETKYNNSTVVNSETDVDIVTAAEHLRFAADSLAKITGRGESGDVEDVLGVVFEK
jgi:tRNA modification GTPase